MASTLTPRNNSAEWHSRVVQNYLTAITTLVETQHDDIVHSVILFGSLATKTDFTGSSDVDLLVILKNGVSLGSTRVKLLERQLLFLERHHLRHLVEGKPHLLRVIDFQTGMFRNYFLTTLEEIEKGHFGKIFRTNAFLARLLAPQAITLHSVFQKARVIWGADVRPLLRLPRTFPPTEIIKSMLMNLLMIAGIYAISIFYFRRSSALMNYVMNSVKWTIHTCYTYITGKSSSIEEESAFFLQKMRGDTMLKRALLLHLELRRKRTINGVFFLLAPYLTWKLHVMTLSRALVAKHPTHHAT